jgi:hypothetical protein
MTIFENVSDHAGLLQMTSKCMYKSSSTALADEKFHCTYAGINGLYSGLDCTAQWQISKHSPSNRCSQGKESHIVVISGWYEISIPLVLYLLL